MKLKNLLLIALVAIVFCGCQSNYQPTSITVASYNLRNANGGDSINGNGWGQRYPVIAQIVQYHDFDIFGTQECFIHQLKDIKEALPGYDYIGVGRDDTSNAKIPASNSFSSTCTWTISARKHAWKVRSSYRTR